MGPLQRGTARSATGWTLLEMMLVILILSTLAGMAIPKLRGAIDQAKVARAIGDIGAMQAELTPLDVEGKLPATLAGIGRGGIRDPWGNPYQYLRFDGKKSSSKARKDRFLVPINTSYDLYSMGKDGATQSPLSAKVSHDDIVRANDGSFVGLASDY